MRVLHVSTSDVGHGAGIASYRLLCAQRQAGIDAAMLVAEKLSNNPDVICVRDEPTFVLSRLIFRCDLFIERLLNVIGPQNLHSVVSRSLLRHDLLRSADIIHLHNLHWHSRNYSLLLPLLLGRRKPVVWTFHDMWPITGHCISSRDCERWRIGCGSCPYPRAYLGQLIDSSRMQCNLKRALFRRANFTIVTPSAWLAGRVQDSSVVVKQQVRVIANSIDTECFRPVDKKVARELLGLADPEMPAVLFVSAFLDDPIKGYSFFEEALCRLHDISAIPKIQVLLVGRGSAGQRLKDRYPVTELGYIENQLRMAQVYAAANLYVMPSILDNLPSVVLESLACGTPVVCFNTGGIPEMVCHGVNGYVARHGDVVDLATGMQQILTDDHLREEMGRAGIATVTKSFGVAAQVTKHLELYHELLARCD